MRDSRNTKQRPLANTDLAYVIFNKNKWAFHQVA